MGTRLHLNLSANFVGFAVLVMPLWLILTVCRMGFASQTQQSEEVLQTVRALVQKNESSAALIKMEYTLRYSRSEDDDGQPEAKDLSRTGNLRARGVRFSHYNGLWAQDGVKQHSSKDYFSQGEWHKGSTTILDGEVKKWGQKPDLMLGAIDHMEMYNWRDLGLTKLGMRPFEAHNWLSELLVPEYASAYERTEMKDGRKAYVVDVKRASEPAYYARMWIDLERGLPIQIEYRGRHPSVQGQRLMCKVESIKHHQLPNGGWIPVAGTRSVFYPNSHPRVRSAHVVVDVNSITIERDEIPESLFTLRFPKGARVSNNIVGMNAAEMDLIADMGVQSVETSDGSPAVTAAANQSTQALPGEQPPQAPNQAPSKDPEGLEHGPPVMSQTGNKSFGVIGILLCTLLGASALTLAIWIIRNGRKVEGQGGLK